MCGIAGFFSFDFLANQGTLDKMSKSLEKRGPDGTGFFIKDFNTFRVGLVHRRLAIIDLSEGGNQPMHTPRCSIVFNGEIYNYQEIRSQLLKTGVQFKTQSDTEVLLQAYQCWGIEKTLNMLRGMFAFSLIDWDVNIVYLARDRAGVKPLNFTVSNNYFGFASTITALKSLVHHPNINGNSLGYYLQTGYVPGNSCIYNEIEKVQPGHYIKYCLQTKKIDSIKYWSVYDIKVNTDFLKMSNSDLLNIIEEQLKESFNYRLVSDVPVGIFLSGGYDSTAVLALLSTNNSNLSTYTIGFEDKKYDESKFAKIISNHFGAKHNEFICTIKDAQNYIPQIQHAYDEPFGDSSAIPTLMLSEYAQRHVKVALSADGGDELFAGYDKHFEGIRNIKKATELKQKLYWLNRYIKWFKKNGQINLNSSLFPTKIYKILSILLEDYDFHEIQNLANIYTNKDTLERLDKSNVFLSGSYFRHTSTPKGYIPNDYINDVLKYDFSTYLVDDVLTKVDRATMYKSLEGRDPFLDNKLIELLYSIPGELKTKNNIKKSLLKSIVHRHIPEEMMNRPKKGFSVPVREWMRGDLQELLIDTLNKETMHKDEYLDKEYVIQLRDNYLRGDTSKFEVVWYIFSYISWLNKE